MFHKVTEKDLLSFGIGKEFDDYFYAEVDDKIGIRGSSGHCQFDQEGNDVFLEVASFITDDDWPEFNIGTDSDQYEGGVYFWSYLGKYYVAYFDGKGFNLGVARSTSDCAKLVEVAVQEFRRG